MPDFQLLLSTEEKTCLQLLLENLLPGKRVEVHRTDSLDYRHGLEHEVKVIEGLLAKLKKST